MIPSFNPSSSSVSPSSTLETSNDEDRQQQFFIPNSFTTASSSSLPCHDFFSSTDQFYPVSQQDQTDDLALHGGSYDRENQRNNSLKFSLWYNNETDHESTNVGAVKWMSSNVRTMQKMKKSDQKCEADTFKLEEFQITAQPSSPHEETHNSISNSCPVIRVCSDCNTTKTPLWRSGPKGPKSLCNACGIRQRKARRAMAAAAAEAPNGIITKNETTATMKAKLQQKEKTKNVIRHVAHQNNKKRYKSAAAAAAAVAPSSHGVQKNLCFEELFLSLSKKLQAFHQVFPPDEKEAAILLMALSCGLISS